MTDGKWWWAIHHPGSRNVKTRTNAITLSSLSASSRITWKEDNELMDYNEYWQNKPLNISSERKIILLLTDMQGKRKFYNFLIELISNFILLVDWLCTLGNGQVQMPPHYLPLSFHGQGGSLVSSGCCDNHHRHSYLIGLDAEVSGQGGGRCRVCKRLLPGCRQRFLFPLCPHRVYSRQANSYASP